MPTKKIGIYNTGQTLFSTPRHVVGKIDHILIDNRDTQNTIILQDMFSSDVTKKVASPIISSNVLVQVTVNSGQTISIDASSLKGIRTFGIVNAYGSTSADCVLVVGYHYE